MDLLALGESKKTLVPHKIRYCCPYCGDTKFKFVVDILRKNFVCWKCGYRGRLEEELKTNVDFYQRKVGEFKNGKSSNRINQGTRLPTEMRPIVERSGTPYLYLRKRGLSNQDIRRYQIGYCSDGTFRERIILPIFEDGNLVYFIGRTYTSREPKYLNVGAGRGKILFKTFDGTVNFCVLTEGAFDAISVGRVFPAIALLGKVCSHSQAKKISLLTDKVYVMLDKDASWDNAKLAYGELSHYVTTYPIFINKKDPGVMTPREIKEMIHENL